MPGTPVAGIPQPGTALDGGKTGSDRDSCINPASGINTRKDPGSSSGSANSTLEGSDFVSSFGFGGTRGTTLEPAAPCPDPLSGTAERLHTGQAIAESTGNKGVRVVFSFWILEFIRSLKG